jgi:hypothetical protein
MESFDRFKEFFSTFMAVADGMIFSIVYGRVDLF